MQATNVTAPDGLNLAVQEWGNPHGPEILLIHGFNQSHLSWLRQVDDPALAANFRMITLDLRGHGSSDKPLDKERYAHARWGDDITAVIKACGLRRPVLVGWSFGGNVICDYVRGFEPTPSPASTSWRRRPRPKRRTSPRATKFPQHAVRGSATNRRHRAFLRPASNANRPRMHSNHARFQHGGAPRSAAIFEHPRNTATTLAQIKCPVLVTHGTKDKVLLVALGRFTAAAVPGAKLSLYDGVGHGPFWEDAARFNQVLAEFMRGVNMTKQ
jgi:pimeloyl-ACP methyl ester carboxylesterase